MDPAGKLLAERAVDGMKERGHTNLSGGLLAALEVLYRSGKQLPVITEEYIFTI